MLIGFYTNNYMTNYIIFSIPSSFRSNDIQDFSEINKLTCLPALKVLVLSGKFAQDPSLL